MQDEVKEILEPKKSVRSVKSINLKNIPISVHNKLIKYQADLIGKHRKSFTLEDAYREFIKEHSKSLK